MARRLKEARMERFNFLLEQIDLENIQILKQKNGCMSSAEAIRQSLRFSTKVQELMKDGILTIINPETNQPEKIKFVF